VDQAEKDTEQLFDIASRLRSIQSIADEYQVSRAAVDYWLTRRGLRSIRFHTAVLVHEDDLTDFMKDYAINSYPGTPR
jgi:hypothetical protein